MSWSIHPAQSARRKFWKRACRISSLPRVRSGGGMGWVARCENPIRGYELPNIFNPDDLMDSNMESNGLPLKLQKHTPADIRASALQNIIIYDDDHYYMGGVLAELL